MICHVTIQVVYELPATSQWMFECHWCPRNPAIISTASFDGHISLYSLLGGGGKEVVPETHKVLWGGRREGGGTGDTQGTMGGGGGGGREGRRWCQRHTRYYVLCAHIQRYLGGGGNLPWHPASAQWVTR